MSKLRVVLRIFFVAIIVGLLGLGYYIWVRSRPDFYYDRAQAAVEREEFTVARVNLVNLIQRHPEHGEGYALLSRVILQEARSKGAPPTYAANPAALQALERAAELRPLDDDVQRRLLSAYLQMRHFSKAAAIAESVYRVDPENADAHLALTWKAVKEGNEEEVERRFAEGRGLTSRHVFHESALKISYYTDRGDSAKVRETMTEALQLAESLTAEQLRDLTAFDREIMLQVLLLAQSQANNTDLRLKISQVVIEACERLRQAKLLDANIIAKYSSISQNQINEGLSGTTLNERQRALRRQLNDMAGEISESATSTSARAASADVYWNTARKMISENRVDEALKVLKDGIAKWEAQAQAKQPSGTESEDEAERILSDDELRLHLFVGRILIMLQRYQEAQEHLAKLDGHEEYEGWGHLLQGELLVRDGQLAAARDEYLRAQTALEPQIQVQTSLARVYLGMKDWEAAIPYLEAMLTPVGELSEDEQAWRRPILGYEELVHLDLLRARLNAGRWDDAQANLLVLRETELAPEAWKITVRHLWQNKEHEKAITYLKKAREKFPDDIQMVFLEAGFLQEQGQSTSAEALFEEFVAASRNDPIRRLAQARWLIRDGKSDKALRVLNPILRTTDLTPKARNTSLILQAQALIELERYEEAAASIDLLTEEPATAAAGYLLKSIVAQRQGNEVLGRQSLERAHQWDLRDPGSDKVIMQVRMPQGDVVGVSVRDAYYW